ncbi:MAG: cob(I)yrinic acid a,c-diamide adenosyltransferase [Candidatus Omnitrophota bacterium]|jgi:cob(I)alamin adenosyltransferase
MKTQGLIQVYTGDGKGKTTAAFGVALRTLGHGGRVGVVQFFKYPIKSKALNKEGAFRALEKFSNRFHVWSFGGGFTWQVIRKENAKAVQKAWKQCRVLLKNSKYDLVIFDEIHIALLHKFLKVSDVVKALKYKRSGQHVILTGRGAPPAIIRLADLVTEMKCVKHPLGRGILAQPGVEF